MLLYAIFHVGCLTWFILWCWFSIFLLMDLIFGHFRGCGDWRGKHRVRLCGLWRTTHHTQWCRSLLLQYGQSLAMTAVNLRAAGAINRWREWGENIPKQAGRGRMEEDVTVQHNPIFWQKEGFDILFLQFVWLRAKTMLVMTELCPFALNSS